MKGLFRLLIALSVSALGFIYYQTMTTTRATIIPDNYFVLRERFLAASRTLSAQVQTLPVAARGPEDEELFIDIAWIGSQNPKRVLLHISGTHGVEGYAGSAIQSAILENGALTIPPESAVVFVHALNPWGMAHKRRFNERNVDLNRNFLLDQSKYTGAPESYRLVEGFLNPKGPPQRIDLFYPEAIFNVVRHGYNALKQAIAGGQYEFPQGIYFGGKEMEQSLHLFKEFVQTRLANVETLYVIEIHTGLGEWAKDVLFWPLSPRDAKTISFEQALGETLSTDDPDQGVGFKTPGDLQNEVPKLLPHCDTYWMLQEFGAYGAIKTLRALRDENRYYHSGGTDLNHWSKQVLVETFSPGAEDWQKEIVRRGKELFGKLLPLLGTAAKKSDK